MKKSVLVVEDNEQNLYLMRYLLEENGYECISARDGKKGIELATQIKPAIILLDIQLPEIDGYAVARELRKDVSMTHTVIIAVTSYAMPGDRERALEAGCTGYIEKPINPDTFLDEIEQYLANSLDEGNQL